VLANQASSLGFALLTVTLALSLRFRSVSAGAVAAAPTGLSLLIIYGAMGLLGVRLDIGTSMLASLVIGAGVDYAVHLMSAWEAREPEPPEAGGVRAGARAGVAVWINALAVAIGFFVLTLGEARPLRNVGGLTAAAMVVAASCTFAVLPVLARRRRYRGEAGDAPADAAARPHLWSP
jgi:predicted RND superfamily exporter protein